jgi:LacI family transcriptional regulator
LVIVTAPEAPPPPLPPTHEGRKRVLVVVSPIWEESAAKILKGIAAYQRSDEPWETEWDNEGRSLHDARIFSREHWDGIISRHTNELQVEIAHRLGIPLVDVNNAKPWPGVPNITLNNRTVGQLGGEHFIDQGFRHFAFCGFGNEVWSIDRREGFREALQTAKRECVNFETDYPGYYTGGCTPAWEAQEIEQIAAWLKDLPRPIGIMACNDFRALHILKAAPRARCRVPEDVAVLGANNDEARCELAHPPLSSIATNHQQSGYVAAQVLARLMRRAPLEGMDLMVDPSDVMARQSTDLLAVEDRQIAAAIRFIHQNACKGITVAEVGRAAGLARTQLEEKFRRYITRSPQAEIRRVQLSSIRQLLQDTDLPIRTIADITGFSHPEYLIVFFKREMGESPGRYRSRVRGRLRLSGLPD